MLIEMVVPQLCPNKFSTQLSKIFSTVNQIKHLFDMIANSTLPIRYQETLLLMVLFQLSSSTESSSILCSSTFELHFDLTLVVDILILFRWMINGIFEYVFVIGNRFIIVNIYKLVFVLCITKVLITLKRSTGNIYKEYTTYALLKTKPCVTTQCPFNVHSPSPQVPSNIPIMSIHYPLTHPSTRNHKTVLTTASFYLE